MDVYLGCANYFPKVDVHPIVTANKVSIVGFAIFKLYQLEMRKYTQNLE